MEVKAITERLARRYDKAVLEALLDIKQMTPEQLADERTTVEWARQLENRLNANGDGGNVGYSVETAIAEEAERWHLVITRMHHGVQTTRMIRPEFFESAEYRRISELGAELADLVGEGAFVIRGDKHQDVGDFPQAVAWLMKEARRGQAIQRYKGLGEMNPDQLWDTTVNPETRRLMQVRIEDAVASDEIFTTLMGDHVEPRRDFIERNALSVSNLDI
jgi:DNA gyrase subunit B